MPNAPIPPHVEIAALKKKVVQQSNLMKAGVGTPWEDRGSLGVINAFLRTCFRSMFAPARLWDELSRPETTQDATAFARGCGIIIGISWIVHSLWYDPFHSIGARDGIPPMRVGVDPNLTVNWNYWVIGGALQLAISIFGIVVMLRLANGIYQKMIPHGLAARIPPSLSYNVLAYCLGPSLLVLVPMYGWIVAILWVWVLVIYAGVRRLTLGMSGGLVDGILTMLAVLAIAFGTYFACDFAWAMATPTAVTYTPQPPPPSAGT